MAQLISLRDEPGTQREYETIYIIRSDISTEQVKDVNDKIRRVVEEGKGKLLRVENWGKRKLAYEIKKQLKGIYLYWRYLGPSALVAELERNLRMMDPVIRYMTVHVDENVDPNARPTDVNDETFIAAATTIPDEEDFYLRRGGSDDEDSDDDYDNDADDDSDDGDDTDDVSDEEGEAN